MAEYSTENRYYKHPMLMWGTSKHLTNFKRECWKVTASMMQIKSSFLAKRLW